MTEVSVASFNVHGGVDGWGRPFDVVEACRRLDADILVLQETWTPKRGVGLAEQVASALGYRSTWAPMAMVRRFPVPKDAGASWGPPLMTRPGVGIRVERDGSAASSGHAPPSPGASERGIVGLALLSRRPVTPTAVVDLAKLRRDMVRRYALRSSLDGFGPGLVVVGTHLAHLSQGSLLQVRDLRRLLPTGDAPGVLMGDMNMWGPLLSALLPGWSRAVRGRSWPSWRPTFQIDHIVVNPAVRVVGAEVVPQPGSDHLPVRATLSVA